MREFVKTQVGEFPHTRWKVCDYYTTKSVSGGPIVGYFIDEKDAQDYCDYRNRNLPKPLVINSGEFKI